jgi:uncharacterized protein YgiM (DUF1202 family)
MRTSKSPKAAGAALAAMLATAALATAAAPAQAETLIPGVTGCGASGIKQERGALLGALAGGLLGNRIADGDRGTGTLLGAALGAGVGSAVGCQMQHNDVDQRGSADRPRTYRHGGYALNSGVAPAAYDRVGQTLVATETVNLRAAPSRSGERVGQLRRGERFEALAEVRGSDWILVGRNGVGVGYVKGAYTRAEGYRYASY